MLITHDLGVVADMAQRVVVMYAGRKVEEAAVADLFAARCIRTRAAARRVPRLGSSLSARRARGWRKFPDRCQACLAPARLRVCRALPACD